MSIVVQAEFHPPSLVSGFDLAGLTGSPKGLQSTNCASMRERLIASGIGATSGSMNEFYGLPKYSDCLMLGLYES